MEEAVEEDQVSLLAQVVSLSERQQGDTIFKFEDLKKKKLIAV